MHDRSFSRRQWLGAALAGCGGVLVRSSASAADASPAFLEPARSLPLVDDADVIVAGGGPAGFAAAVAAARAGARTRLFEVHGCLGGVWTAGLLTWIFDFDKPGLAAELTRRLDRRDARRHKNPARFGYEIEPMKRLLEEMCGEAGVKTQLHTRVAAAYLDQQRLTTIATESKSGRQAWRAKAFVDATGDGDLAAQAGCGWESGHPTSHRPQPLTMNALVVVHDVEALRDCISFYAGDLNRHQPAVEAFRRELEQAGVRTSYGHPTLFQVRDNLLTLMINHEYGVDAFDAAQLTEATLRARAEIHRVVDALRARGGRWHGFQLVATAEQIGIREGRRIHGRYRVTQDDLLRGARHDDAVAQVTFNVDVHALTAEDNRREPVQHLGMKIKPYDIPLRALMAEGVDGLLLAGRCISGDFVAHASYRVTGNAVAMGQAAGVTAALGARSGRLPHEVPWKEVEEAIG